MSKMKAPGFGIRLVVSIAWGSAVQCVGCAGELPHANRHARQESPRECLWKNIATSIAQPSIANPSTSPCLVHSASQTRYRAVYYGAHLCIPRFAIRAQLLVVAITIPALMHLLPFTTRCVGAHADRAIGRYHGGYPDIRSTGNASAYGTLTLWSAPSIPHYDAWDKS